MGRPLVHCRVIAVIVMISIGAIAAAETSMWVVEKNGNRLYLGGTIHVLSKEDYPLPPEFGAAYAEAEMIVLETDPDALNSPGMQRQLLSRMAYQDGTTLQDHLSQETWRKLAKYSEERGIPLEGLKIFKPGMLVITLTVVELQRLELLGTGVDQYFANIAAADGKPVDKLETAERQLEFLSRLGEDDPDAAIRYTLRDLDQLPSLFRSIRRHWRTGDLEGLDQTSLAPLKLEFPAVYEMLLVQRNNDWLPKLEQMLDTAEVELILVGALHLVGEDGLLALLRARDYTVSIYQQ